MKSKMCKGCRCFWPKGSTAFNYDVCNFKFASIAVQRLKECPNGKPIYFGNLSTTESLMSEKHTLREWMILMQQHPELREEFEKMVKPKEIE